MDKQQARWAVVEQYGAAREHNPALIAIQERAEGGQRLLRSGGGKSLTDKRVTVST